MKKALLFALVIAGCTSSPKQANQFPLVKGFDPGPLEKGYERYVLPDYVINPGDDVNLCQWIEMPSNDDRQVVDMIRHQTAGGHHLTLYASTSIENIGTTRICTTDDMLSVTFLGGGESGGASTISLPGGFAFDFQHGQALMVNAHYLNATDSPIDAQSVVDVKYGDPKDKLASVGFVAVNYDQFQIPAGQSFTADAYCTASTTLSFFMWSNHMHQYGSSEMSELIHPDGTKVMMAQNTSWSNELAYNPPWVKWDVSAPFVVNPGDVFHLQCNWNNTSTSDVIFPTEMCVGTGFVLEAMPQAVCEATATPPAG